MRCCCFFIGSTLFDRCHGGRVSEIARFASKRVLVRELVAVLYDESQGIEE